MSDNGERNKNAYICLLSESFSLYNRIIQLRVRVTDLLLAYKQFKPLRQSRDRPMPASVHANQPSNNNCFNGIYLKTTSLTQRQVTYTSISHPTSLNILHNTIHLFILHFTPAILLT